MRFWPRFWSGSAKQKQMPAQELAQPKVLTKEQLLRLDRELIQRIDDIHQLKLMSAEEKESFVEKGQRMLRQEADRYVRAVLDFLNDDANTQSPQS